MLLRHVRYGVFSTLALSFLLSGCTAAAPATRSSKESISVSRAVTYDSIADLRRDSDDVVIVTAGAATHGAINGLPVTITSVSVSRSILGGGTSFEVQQIGSATVLSPMTSPLLQSGDQYLLFLTRFRWSPDRPTDRFVITGDQGIYELKHGQFVNVAWDSKLPGTVPEGMVDTFVRG